MNAPRLSATVAGTILLAGTAGAQIVDVSQAQATHPLECSFPTNPNSFVEVQPDGTRIELRFKGSALHHWYEDLEGHPVLRVRKHYVYARLNNRHQLRPTRNIVGKVNPVDIGIPRHIVPSPRPSPLAAPVSSTKNAPDRAPAGPIALGSSSVKNLVILMRFADHGPGGQNRTLPATTDFDTIMNQIGGDPTLAPTGSVKDHYLEDSYNQFTINSTIAGWFTMPEDEADYANGNSGLTSYTWNLIRDGLDAADPSIDFSDFDEDGDGWVDAITFLHSGYGAEWGGSDQYGTPNTDRMWSHKWTISPPWTSAEGIKVAEYNISPGLWATSGSGPGRIGVVVHELGHFFGLPDLYDTNGSGQGIGNWCVMAAGSWGFDGSQQFPSHMSAWCKDKMGWLTPQTILPGSFMAPQVETNQSVFRIDSGYPAGEYFLLENRQQTGFDGVIPQGGLAVWHIDDAKGAMGFNNPNTEEGFPGQAGWPGNDNHYRNALMQADGGYDMERNFDRGDSGDLYHAGGVNQITNASTPGTDTYQGGVIVDNDNRITGIGTSGANVAFTYSNSTLPSINTSSVPPAEVDAPYSQSLSGSGGTGGPGSYSWTEVIANPSYTGTEQASSLFSTVGVAQGWNADDDTWALNLPFAFPYYGDAYETVYVSSNGFIALHAGEPEPANQATHQKINVRISPLWDDLQTDQPGEDIYVESLSDQVTVRWDASEFGSGTPCNFSVVLHRDGGIEFHYGSGNNNLSPTVGISRGSGNQVIAPVGYNGASSLTNANSYFFDLSGSQIPPGMTLSTGGVLSGTPTVRGSWAPTFKLTDGDRNYDLVTLGVDVILDCNGNLVDDDIDLAMGTSADCNSNDLPDECEPGDPCEGLYLDENPKGQPLTR